MKKGDWVHTPRFCNVKITHVYRKRETALKNGFIGTIYYENPDYEV